MIKTFVTTLALAIPGVASANPTATAVWEKISETDDGIATYRKEIAGSSIVAFRGEGILEAPLTKVVAVLEDIEGEKEWMADLAESAMIERVSESERWEYNRTAAPWPISDRDFVIHVKGKFQKDPIPTLTFEMVSRENAKRPAIAGVVRGDLLESKFEMKAITRDKTHFTCEILADPKGSLPKWIVNLFQKSWPRDTIEGLRKQLKKPGIQDNPWATRMMTGLKVPASLEN